MVQRVLITAVWCWIFISKHVEAEITNLIDTFSDQLESLMCDGLRIGGDKCANGKYGIQDFVYSFESHFDTDISDASDVAQSIIDRLDTKLNQRASFLTNLSHIIRSECVTHMTAAETESLTSFDNLYFAGNADRASKLPTDMEYSEVYAAEISLTASTYKLPDGVDTENENIQRDARISQLLDSTMRSLYDDHCVDSTDETDEYCNMYFGTINGLFRQYPGVENTKESGTYIDYDPRFRPWYVSAATGSKDVVILLDISNSMKQNNRLIMAKQAVVSVLNTLGSSSFVNVVAFSDELTLSCFERTLVSATHRNVAELVDFVENIQANGETNFTIAFNAAFDILQSAQQCQTVILFLTDGAAEDVSALITERNTVDISAVVFSFTLGDEATADVPQKLARITDGIYTHIDDADANLITAMSSYYLYFAYGGSSAGDSERDDIILTSPYLDFDTDVVMITMALPVYINKTYFVGVVGTDIPLSFLSDAIGDITIGRKSYSFVINEESEVLLHPFIPDAFELLDSNEEYKAIFIQDVEPNEYVSTLLQKMLKRQAGSTRIDASIKVPAGDVTYNGYIYENADLLYIYAGVGPSSLSIAMVIYSESNVAAPNVPSFGLKGSPSVVCDGNIDYVTDSSDLSACVAPFNLFHRLDRMKKCDSDWLSTAQVLNGNDSANADLHYNAFYEGQLYSVQYPIYYLQSGLFEQQLNALNVDPTCEALDDLHTLSNRLGHYDADNLPFGGFRAEISGNVLNSIFTLSSLHEFWKPAFLANDSLFVSMWFGHFQGLHISYPAKQFKNTYNNLVRPWYQRAMSYPSKMVWITPYLHATTGKLVTGANSVIYAPNSDYAFGVAGFNYEYGAFVQYWKDEMGSVCFNESKTSDSCYLIDSSGFCLHYDDMEDDTADEDIGRKFVGDFEPTIMQSLLDRGFFVNDTNVNYQDDTVDITYIIDPSIDVSAFASTDTTFAYNSGTYTVHAVAKTNLWVIYIEGDHRTNLYPNDCPNNAVCPGVSSPGCIKTGSKCVSATVDVCSEPDTTVTAEGTATCSFINALGICALNNEEEGDMCASNFIQNPECKDTSAKGEDTTMMIVLIVAGVVLVVVVIVVIVVCKKKKKENETRKDDNALSPDVELGDTDIDNAYPPLAGNAHGAKPSAPNMTPVPAASAPSAPSAPSGPYNPYYGEKSGHQAAQPASGEGRYNM